MSNLCKTYASKIKSLFPIMGKTERKYINTIKINVNDYLGEKPNSNLEDLYKEFGTPKDVINSYYATIDTESIIKRIKFTKYIKISVYVLIICLLSSTIYYLRILYEEHHVFMEEQIYSEETIIE